MGQRIFLKEVQPYKEEKHEGLELIQYQGAIMKAIVAHVGVDCKHHSVGETVIFQALSALIWALKGQNIWLFRNLT